ncbi:unnamed protein product, partial [Durusdinium trenchii]
AFLLSAHDMRWFLGGLPWVWLTSATARWSAEHARAWAPEWRLGANYLPSNCGNVLELFAAKSVDRSLLTAERELRVARAAGFSSLRVFLHEELFYQDGTAFLGRISRFLALFQRHGMSAMLVLFDACWRPDMPDAGEHLPGVHNSAWVQCPTHDVLRAFAESQDWAHERLQRYVTEVVRFFADDPRVVVWDIYNEPTQRQSEHLILPRLSALKSWPADQYPEHWMLDGPKLQAIMLLLEKAFTWARAAKPTQPLTTAIWEFPSPADSEDVKQFKEQLNQKLIDLSDVPSLHCYCPPSELDARLVELEALDRGPALVTEFMARPLDSTLTNSLPVLKRRGAPGYTWGLFRGKSNTHDSLDDPWFHDVFYENGTAYDEDELKSIWWHTIGSALHS